MTLAILTRFFVWIPVSALALVSALLIKRRIYRELPFFFLYAVSALLIGGLRFLAFYLGRVPYFYTYWITELTGTIFIFLALYELFLRRLFPGFRKSRLYRNLFPFVAVVILLLTVISALFAQDKQAVFVNASRQFDFVRTAMLVFFTALMILMGRNWSRYELGIAAGFAIQAAAALANAAIRFRSRQPSMVLDILELVTYDLSCLIWLFTFLKAPPRVAIPGGDETSSNALLSEARTWEKVLKNWLSPKTRVF